MCVLIDTYIVYYLSTEGSAINFSIVFESGKDAEITSR